MRIEPALVLAQWLSPAYPVGAFAYSHGLERLAETGQVRDAQTLADWLEDVVARGAGRTDTLFLAAAYRAGTDAELARIDAEARAFAPSRERLLETDLMGAAFGAVTGAVWGKDLAGLSYPVALGRAARVEGLPLELTAQMYLQAFVSNLVGAALRLLPLGQTAGQALVRRLTPLCAEIATAAVAEPLEALCSTAFLGDVASMQHETQRVRIFRT